MEVSSAPTGFRHLTLHVFRFFYTPQTLRIGAIPHNTNMFPFLGPTAFTRVKLTAFRAWHITIRTAFWTIKYTSVVRLGFALF
jgi:hypothetical protein